MASEKIDQLKSLIPENDCNRFTDYLERLKEGSIEKTEVFIFESSIEDKAIRSKIHQFFKNETSIFETDTTSTG